MSWNVLDVPRIDTGVHAHVPMDGSDIVLFDDASRRTYRLAGTACPIWLAIDGISTVGAIVELLCQQHDADPDEISHDVIAMLTQLRDGGILTARPPSA